MVPAGRAARGVRTLSTHTPACLYEAFAPDRTRAIAEQLEWDYTPKHGLRPPIPPVRSVRRPDLTGGHDAAMRS